MDHSEELLQSERWLRFQESTGKDIIPFSDGGFRANGILHELPVVGAYLYVPRGPIVREEETGDKEQEISKGVRALVAKARSAGAKWIRVEPETEDLLDSMRRSCGERIVKAPHDVQPRETFVVDVSKGEGELLAGMKSKTRYNIRLAEKKGVQVTVSRDGEYRDAFIGLVRGTALRKGLVPHPEAYYRRMLDAFLGDAGALFVASHEGDILGINLVVRHGDTATYLHGGSSTAKREHMAPFLLQWAAMRDARNAGCAWYDFGGVKTEHKMQDAGCRMQKSGDKKRNDDGKNHASLIMHHVSDDWSGITRFKTGFSPATVPKRTPGSYDIVLDRRAYRTYDMLRLVRENAVYLRKFMRI